MRQAPTDSDPTAADIAEHLPEISAAEPFTIPGSIFEEVLAVCERLGFKPGDRPSAGCGAAVPAPRTHDRSPRIDAAGIRRNRSSR